MDNLNKQGAPLNDHIAHMLQILRERAQRAVNISDRIMASAKSDSVGMENGKLKPRIIPHLNEVESIVKSLELINSALEGELRRIMADLDQPSPRRRNS